jgi:chromate transporter
MTALLELTRIFFQLSFLAIGGGITIIPEMQREVVINHHWMSAEQFNALYAVAQASPGPNVLIAPLIGWHVAGWIGLAAVLIVTFTPWVTMTAIAVNLWNRFRDRPWRIIAQSALVPVTTGIIAASATVMTHSIVTGWVLGVVAFAGAAVMAFTRIHPLFILAAGALVGLSGFGQ